MRKRANPKFKIFHLVDLLAIALAVAHAFGRIGCLAAGCCWGAITSSGWGIHYGPGTFAYLELAKDPHWHPIITAAGQTPGMHPSQLYEAFGEFIIFGIMCLIAYRQHKRQEVQIQHEVDAGFVPAPGSSVTINEAGQRTLEPNAALSSALSGLSALDKNANTEKPENKVETVKSQASAENNPASAEKQAAKAENKTEKSEPTVLPENKANHVENKAESPENKANAADIKAEEEAKKLKERLALFEKYLPDHPGRITAIWFIGYGVLRFFVEMMRDDTERGYYFQQVFPSLNELLNVDPNHVTILTTSQGIALGMIIFGVIALVSSTKKHA